MSVLTDRCNFGTNTRVFAPGMFVISSITNANPAVVTTTANHDYVDGAIVRFDIQPACGMDQIDGMTSSILVTGATTFTTLIDTTLFAPFTIPVAPDVHTNICSLVVCMAENNDTLKNAVRNVL